ncbi:glycosyl hydrolase family 18 protein [Kangiella sp.]|uniref:glycosyl hydrolase family 18 protein n=1 Tax=Kangiella sp. TaxID=1920245 RepID=UPI003A8C9655
MQKKSNGMYAWILLGENNPSGTNYNDSISCYQTLNRFNVYQTLDAVNLCFFVTVKRTDGSWTIELGNKDQTYPSNQPGNNTHPSTQDYMEYVIRDAKAANPNMLFLATLGYNEGVLSNIFSGSDDSTGATNFANNLVEYLADNNLDGFDLDWEYPVPNSITSEQFSLLFNAIRKAFDASSRKYYLTISPAGTGSMVAEVVNQTTDWLNVQAYGPTSKEDYTNIGIDEDLLSFGAKYESTSSYDIAPYQTPQQAHSEFLDYSSAKTCTWRLNSGNYQSEQAYQLIYSQLVRGMGLPFDDSDILGAIGSPVLEQLVIRHGDVINAIQTANSAPFTFNNQTVQIDYSLLLHGSETGTVDAITIPSNDSLVAVTISRGTWFGWQCVVQVLFECQSGQQYGPFGTMHYATNIQKQTYKQEGKSLVGFKGRLVKVPLSNLPDSNIVADLEPIFM